MMMNEFYPDGTLVLSINGESDSDEDGQDRNTGPRAWGYIADYSPECGYSLYFTNGTTVYADREALENRNAYIVVKPDEMAERLNELQKRDATLKNIELPPSGDDYEAVCELFQVTSA